MLGHMSVDPGELIERNESSLSGTLDCINSNFPDASVIT